MSHVAHPRIVISRSVPSDEQWFQSRVESVFGFGFCVLSFRLEGFWLLFAAPTQPRTTNRLPRIYADGGDHLMDRGNNRIRSFDRNAVAALGDEHLMASSRPLRKLPLQFHPPAANARFN